MKPSFVVANSLRASSDLHAQVFDSLGILRSYLSGTRRLTEKISPEVQKRFPPFEYLAYATARTLSTYRGECARFALAPVFESWARRHLKQGDNLLTGLGYLNLCMEDVKSSGGLAILEARNSHPSNFWSLVAEEHARWDCKLPPIWPRHHLRQQRSVALADYIFVPSRFVEQSYIDRGFPRERLLRLPYPVDISLFKPKEHSRPKNQPLTIVSSGLLTLRKGSPYLFEAFKLIKKEVPDARLKLIHQMANSFRQVYDRQGYRNIAVDWSNSMPHAQLATWLQTSDIFLLPTIEEGMVRSALEAMACGLPAVTTPHAGVDDYICNGKNGTVVPVRNPRAIADAVLDWWEKIRTGAYNPYDSDFNRDILGMETFTFRIRNHLHQILPTKFES